MVSHLWLNVDILTTRVIYFLFFFDYNNYAVVELHGSTAETYSLYLSAFSNFLKSTKEFKDKHTPVPFQCIKKTAKKKKRIFKNSNLFDDLNKIAHIYPAKFMDTRAMNSKKYSLCVLVAREDH